MCDQKPRRVPGVSQASRRLSHIPRPGPATWASTPGGWFRSTASTSTIARTPSAAAEANAGVQPGPCSSAASGIALSTWPSWPMSPVSWVMTGARRGGNQAFTTRSTLMNVNASPAPTSARARKAAGSADASASVSCPAAMISPPTRISRRAPNRSSSNPTGTCSTAYTTSCRTTNVDSTAGATWNRAVASSPATPNDDRWSTATR